MKGLELSRRYFLEVGCAAISGQFPELVSRIAFGSAGEGSENLGYDDEFSRDHDFGAGFCMWLTDEDEERYGDALREAYDALGGPFLGYPKKPSVSYGVRRQSAMASSAFYRKFTACPEGPRTLAEWIRVPEDYLAAATSGEVFLDESGEFSAVRSRLLGFYPGDVRLELIARRVYAMGQSGQYNYPRCARRHDAVAAALSLREFVLAACSLVCLLNRKYAPFYKWIHRATRDLPVLPDAHDLIGRILEEGCPPDAVSDRIEQLCALVVMELRRQGMTDSDDVFLASQAGPVRSRIKDDAMRTGGGI